MKEKPAINDFYPLNFRFIIFDCRTDIVCVWPDQFVMLPTEI